MGSSEVGKPWYGFTNTMHTVYTPLGWYNLEQVLYDIHQEGKAPMSGLFV